MNKPTGDTLATTVLAPLFANEYKIYINHTDAGGIVYHANHLVFFENCRRDWFTQLGLEGYFMQDEKGQVQHFVVRQADLQFKKAILLDETITVQIDKVELKPASIVFYQSIHRKRADNNHHEQTFTTDSLLSSTKIVIACVQNKVLPESANHNNVNTNNAVDAINANPMRPIRVPKTLHDTIKDAILQHNQ